MSDAPKFDPLKPAPPKLPGVTSAAPGAAQAAEPGILRAGERAPAEKLSIPFWVWPAAGVVGLALLVILYFLLRPAEKLEPVVVPQPEETPTAAVPEGSTPPPVLSGLPIAPQDDVATVEEMAKPWSVKKFLFAKREGGAEPALLIRLPVGAATSASSYWAFSARPPYGKCEVELVTDRTRLKNEFAYNGPGPMVVDPCEKVVYNPLSYGHVRGVLVRGEVVQGSGFRPPLAIELQVNGNRIQATRIEQ